MLLLASSVCGLFKWRQFEPEVILLAAGWYLRFSLSYRDVEELLAERGLHADHVTVWRWVQRYTPELQRRLRGHLKPTNDSWRVDETYIRVKGSRPNAMQPRPSAFLPKRSAEQTIRRRESSTPTSMPLTRRRLCTQSRGVLEENCQHRPVQYLNNVLEQDHRAIKRPDPRQSTFQVFLGRLAHYEAVHMIRKGQACESATGTGSGLLHRFVLGMFGIEI
jgi:transposase, IS6 family